MLSKGWLLMHLMDVAHFNKSILMRFSEGLRVHIMDCALSSLLGLLSIT